MKGLITIHKFLRQYWLKALLSLAHIVSIGEITWVRGAVIFMGLIILCAEVTHWIKITRMYFFIERTVILASEVDTSCYLLLRTMWSRICIAQTMGPNLYIIEGAVRLDSLPSRLRPNSWVEIGNASGRPPHRVHISFSQPNPLSER